MDDPEGWMMMEKENTIAVTMIKEILRGIADVSKLGAICACIPCAHTHLFASVFTYVRRSRVSSGVVRRGDGLGFGWDMAAGVWPAQHGRREHGRWEHGRREHGRWEYGRWEHGR